MGHGPLVSNSEVFEWATETELSQNMLEYSYLGIYSLKGGNALVVFSSKILTEMHTGVFVYSYFLEKCVCLFMRIKAQPISVSSNYYI